MGDSIKGKGRGRFQRNNENQKRGGARKKNKQSWDESVSHDTPYPDKNVNHMVEQLRLDEAPPNQCKPCHLDPNAKPFEPVAEATFENSNNSHKKPDDKPMYKSTGRVDKHFGRKNRDEGISESYSSNANYNVHGQNKFSNQYVQSATFNSTKPKPQWNINNPDNFQNNCSRKNSDQGQHMLDMNQQKQSLKIPQNEQKVDNVHEFHNSSEVSDDWFYQDSEPSSFMQSDLSNIESSNLERGNVGKSRFSKDSVDLNPMIEENIHSGELGRHWTGNKNNYKKMNRTINSSYDEEESSFENSRYSGKDFRGSTKNVTMQRFDTKKREDMFDEYDRKYRTANMKHERVVEVEGDLFSAEKEYALAHCVAEDMNMGSGIALTFRKSFGNVEELLNQKERQGGLAYLVHEGRYVYYLVTKRESNRKPTLITMFKSVNRLKENMVKNGVKKLAIPRLGCGLDRLEWSEVKNMLEFVFRDTEIEIKVFNFQQAHAQMDEKSTDHSFRKCRVTTVMSTIKDFHKKYTMILYLGTEKGDVTREMKTIDERFNILIDYNKSERMMGSYVESYRTNSEYCLIGFIVRKSQNSPFDFQSFKKAVHDLNKENNKAEKDNLKYYNAAIHKYTDPDDPIFMNKITNLIRNTFYQVDISVLAF